MENIYIVLVDPVYKGNVGSVARIMKNFNFHKLRIVGKIPEKEDFVMGMHSEEILIQAKIFNSLKEAVDDIDRVIVMSRRQGNKKKVDLISCDIGKYVIECGEYLSYIETKKDHFIDHIKCYKQNQLRIALVFGRETFGLTDEEADLGDLRCHIPAHEHFPSLNLAQAVSIILYEIYSYTIRNNQQIIHTKDIKATKKMINESVSYSLDVLNSLKIYKSESDKKYISQFITSLLYKSNATRQMAIDFKKIFNRIHISFEGKGKSFKKD